MKKYKLTEKGRKLFGEDHFDVEIWDESDFELMNIDRKSALKLGLFKEGSERIELWRNHPIHAIRKLSADKFTKKEMPILEHAINGEYDQIKEVWKLFIKVWDNYGARDRLTQTFMQHLVQKLKALK